MRKLPKKRLCELCQAPADYVAVGIYHRQFVCEKCARELQALGYLIRPGLPE